MKLEWTQTTSVSIRHTAATPFGTYSAWESGSLYFESALVKRTLGMDSAKLAAQIDFDKRLENCK